MTRKKKSKQNHSHCGHPSVCNSWSCPSQLQLLHFYPLHQNMKSVDLDFFGLSLTWGRMGPSSREEAQGCTPCASHTPLSPQGATTACRAARGTSRNSSGRDGAWSKCQIRFQGQLPPSTAQAEGLAGHTGVTHKGRFAFQNYPSSGAVPYLPFPSAPGDTIPFLHQLGVFGSKGNLIPPQ